MNKKLKIVTSFIIIGSTSFLIYSGWALITFFKEVSNLII